MEYLENRELLSVTPTEAEAVLAQEALLAEAIAVETPPTIDLSSLNALSSEIAEATAASTSTLTVTTNLSGLAANTTYYFRAKSVGVGAYVDSDWSETVSATTFAAELPPTAPEGLNFSRYNSDASGTYVRLRWTDASTDETGFRVEYKKSGESAWTLAGTPKANASNILVYGVEPGVEYEWRVRSYDGAGASIWSETTFTAPIALSSPTLSVGAVDSSTLSIAFEPVCDASGYVCEYSPNADFADSTQVSVVESGSYTISGLAANTTYYFRAKSVGVGAYVDSDWSETVSATTLGFDTPSSVVTTKLDVVDPGDGVISLREAIQAAEAGETITFDASLKGQTITLNGTELAITKGITIDASTLWDAENDVPGLTLNAGGKSRVFNASGGTEENPVELIGLSIVGGYSSGNGGGAYLQGASILRDCYFTECYAGIFGAGVCTVDSEATLTTFDGCSFVGNAGHNAGGAAFLERRSSRIALFPAII